MKNYPYVTVVIPVYNAEKFICETLDSVLSQTYRYIEIICADDCSKDNSVDVISSYIKNNSSYQIPIKLIALEENSGPSTARNQAIAEARGEFILPLDADDVIGDKYIEKAIAVFEEQKDVAVVYCRAAVIGGQGNYDFPEYNRDEMTVRNLVFVTALYRKSDWEKYGGYNKNMRKGLEDWDFWMSFVKENRFFYRIDEVLFYYRVYENSRSALAKTNQQILEKQIRKNHPELYAVAQYFCNPFLRKKFIRSVKRFIKSKRRWLFQLRLRKGEVVLRLFGFYVVNKKRSDCGE